ncbi:MAG TPA: hypothetical protein VKZ43_00845, partial [Trueperaceae bacterium]|nr:hypothetical protein [Trueperaceae bacterium]
MTLSRTARILIAALLVAAAAFFWVNFFNQDPVQGPLVTQPSGVVAPLANPVATDQPAEQEGGVTVADTGAAAGSQDQGAPTVAATTPSDTTPVDTSQAGAADQAADATTTTPVVVDTAPPVIVTGTPTVVTRDLVVEDLPFLVTTPPSAVAGQVDAAAASADRPDVSQRSNINPFSPIVV